MIVPSDGCTADDDKCLNLFKYYQFEKFNRGACQKSLSVFFTDCKGGRIRAWEKGLNVFILIPVGAGYQYTKFLKQPYDAEIILIRLGRGNFFVAEGLFTHEGAVCAIYSGFS